MSEKSYFTINEISRKTQIPPHTLRYWESKFKLLRPLRLKSGHRRYTKRDIEILNDLKDLIYIKGYSLQGAKKLLFKKPASQAKLTEIQNENSSKLLDEIRKDLQKIIKSAD
ncbi:MAG: MerR family transcriptional regulator [Elusimicrobiales bacterium]|nr:MerR family transcriptional regulator [Elusimicrobiales bacterium]